MALAEDGTLQQTHSSQPNMLWLMDSGAVTNIHLCRAPVMHSHLLSNVHMDNGSSRHPMFVTLLPFACQCALCNLTVLTQLASSETVNFIVPAAKHTRCQNLL